MLSADGGASCDALSPLPEPLQAARANATMHSSPAVDRFVKVVILIFPRVLSCRYVELSLCEGNDDSRAVVTDFLHKIAKSPGTGAS